MGKTKTLSGLEKLYVSILLVIFGGIVLHAPLTVAVSTVWPEGVLFIKSWKEILLGVALLLVCIILTRHRRWNLLNNKSIYCIAAFAVLSLLLVPFFYTGFEATVAGMFTNLRFFLFFVLVYIAVRLFPQYYSAFLKVFIAGALLVIGFAVLQATILPHDILKYLGYGQSTIAPYLTVDQNLQYIRINSTLRGPNPLGAYAVIALTVALAALWRAPRKRGQKEAWVIALLVIGSVVALWASYSRSALLAALIAVVLLLGIIFGRKLSTWVWLGLLAVAVVVGGGFVAFRDTTFVSQVIMHEDPNEGNAVNSNQGHAESLVDGVQRMVRQPLGAGVGSTGSASLLTDEPVIIENQYLFVAHEVGWAGLGLFLAITYFVLAGLWQRRQQWLALAVFASGVGLALAGLVLPVWVDDTVSMIWWGLAALCIALPVGHSVRVKKKGEK